MEHLKSCLKYLINLRRYNVLQDREFATIRIKETFATGLHDFLTVYTGGIASYSEYNGDLNALFEKSRTSHSFYSLFYSDKGLICNDLNYNYNEDFSVADSETDYIKILTARIRNPDLLIFAKKTLSAFLRGFVTSLSFDVNGLVKAFNRYIAVLNIICASKGVPVISF